MSTLSLTNRPWERATVTYPFVYWDGAFTSEELQSIIDYCDSIGTHRSEIMGDQEKINEIRKCDIKFHGFDPDNANTRWVFERINGVVLSLNAQFYNFNLNGYESFQYTSYNSAEQGMYNWHMDICMGRDHLPPSMHEPRKLSLTLLLNDPTIDFDGGEFFVCDGNQELTPPIVIPKGRIIVFPSFMTHKVNPVTRGYRKSVVIWVTGPKFV